MQHFDLPVRENSPAVLTAYLHALSPEMPHRARRPAMLVLPGGGYVFCSDREAEPIALEWFCRGYNAFILHYTVITEDCPAPLYQRPLQDAAAAVALLRQHADDWQLDADKIAVIGFSAGGHLAAALGVHWRNFVSPRDFVSPKDFVSQRDFVSPQDAVSPQDPALLKDPAAPQGVVPDALAYSPRPNALVLGYPVISTRAESGPGSIYAAEKLAAGQPDWQRYFACEKNVGPDTPPAFLFATFPDATVSIQHSLCFVQALHAAGVPCEFHLYDRGDHGYALANEETAAPTLPADSHIASWRALAARWLNDLFDWRE